MEILEEKYITKYEALEIIRGETTNSSINSIVENIKNSIKKEIKIEEIEKIKKELKNLGLKENEIVMILDYLPESIEDLNILFGKSIKFFDEEKQKKIIEIVNKI
ncbi:MAG: hypothetical protein QW678_02840 [Candidatus Aenigmatarchaeota archaeon]